ncbi:MAG: hypothetical protein N3F09_01085 [Bacteroidia bacterium]|nr:hypothetical protein [Bacteroidia bacterium]
MQNAQKKCLYCDEPLKGRADKKFCDDQCRANYNYHLTKDANNTVRNINRILKKNRALLEEFLGNEKMKKVNSKHLLDKGFQFRFNTHTLQTQKGNYKFCYEFGYLEIEPGKLLIVKNPDLLK